MGISVYVDGSGGANSGYGYFVKETGESFYEKKPDLTNNQAEYMAIISALNKYVDSDEEIIIHSDSKNTVNQLNHEFAINNEVCPLFGFLEKRIWLEKCWEAKNKRSEIFKNNFIIQNLRFNLSWQNLLSYPQNQLQ